jgi:quercetin dioxygenase-like cupin family protein
MTLHHAQTPAVAADGLSRRQALYQVGAGGLAAALLLRGSALTAAQTASPTPVYAEGITAEILGRIEPPAAPGYALQLVRITFAPGAAIAAHRHSGATVTTQLSGSHTFTVLEGTAHLIRAGTATPAAGSAPTGEPMEAGQDYVLQPGDALVFDESIVHSAHNPTSAPAVLMEAQLRATDHPLTEFMPEMATPVA